MLSSTFGGYKTERGFRMTGLLKISRFPLLVILGLFVVGVLLVAAPSTTVSASSDTADGSGSDSDSGDPSVDDDGDGFSELEGDCNDDDPEVNPDATEISNGVDDDCDGILTKGDWLIQAGVPGKGLLHAKGTIKFFNPTKGFRVK